MTAKRPARKSIPLRVKLAVCERRLRELLDTDRIEYDHRPALWERPVNAEGTDYIPPQNAPDALEALSAEEHSRRTNGTRATTAGSDKHRKAKAARLRGETKNGPKKAIPSRKLEGKGFQSPPEGHKYPWPSQSMPSRHFQKKEARR